MPIRARLDDMLMTEPPPDWISAGIPWRQPRKVPKRSSLITRQNSSIGASTTLLSCGVEPPALLCNTSSRPNLSSALRIALRTLASSVTSVRIAIAPLPAKCAVSSPAARAMSATTTRAPSRAKRTDVARPMPAPAPVMNATLPSSRAMLPPCVSGQENQPQADRGGQSLDEEDLAAGGRGAEETGDEHACEEEHLHRGPAGAEAEPPEKACREKAVVEPLVRGQHLRRSSRLQCLAEGPEAGRLVPEEHLEHQKIEMQDRDETDNDIGGDRHARPSTWLCFRSDESRPIESSATAYARELANGPPPA